MTVQGLQECLGSSQAQGARYIPIATTELLTAWTLTGPVGLPSRPVAGLPSYSARKG